MDVRPSGARRKGVARADVARTAVLRTGVPEARRESSVCIGFPRRITEHSSFVRGRRRPRRGFSVGVLRRGAAGRSDRTDRAHRGRPDPGVLSAAGVVRWSKGGGRRRAGRAPRGRNRGDAPSSRPQAPRPGARRWRARPTTRRPQGSPQCRCTHRRALPPRGRRRGAGRHARRRERHGVRRGARPIPAADRDAGTGARAPRPASLPGAGSRARVRPGAAAANLTRPRVEDVLSACVILRAARPGGKSGERRIPCRGNPYRWGLPPSGRYVHRGSVLDPCRRRPPSHPPALVYRRSAARQRRRVRTSDAAATNTAESAVAHPPRPVRAAAGTVVIHAIGRR